MKTFEYLHRVQTDRLQTDRVQTDKVHTDRAQTDKVKTDRAQTTGSRQKESRQTGSRETVSRQIGTPDRHGPGRDELDLQISTDATFKMVKALQLLKKLFLKW